MPNIGQVPQAFVLVAILLQSQAPNEGPVWFWFATCGGPMMTLEVQLDKRVIQTSVFPVCRTARDSADSQGQKARIEFSFKAGRVLRWTGYRDGGDRSNPDDLLELHVWQAGADPTASILGVSVIGPGRILMNTLHIAEPARRQETAIAPGLVVATYPAKR